MLACRRIKFIFYALLSLFNIIPLIAHAVCTNGYGAGSTVTHCNFEGVYVFGHTPVVSSISGLPDLVHVIEGDHYIYWTHSYHVDGHGPGSVATDLDYWYAFVNQCPSVSYQSNYQCLDAKDISDKTLGAPKSCPATVGGNPINFATGNKYQIETDYLGSGDFPLSVVRSYNSNSRAWFFSHQLLIRPIQISGTALIYQASVNRSDGKKLLYNLNGMTSSSTSQSGLTGATTAIDADITDTLAVELSGSTITGWNYIRAEDDVVEHYTAAGKLDFETNRAGVKHTYTYPSATSIVVTHDNQQSITYTVSGRKITGFTAGGKAYTYGYHSTLDILNSITYPDSGGKRSYLYDGAGKKLLIGITDENSTEQVPVRFATWHYNPDDRAAMSCHGTDNCTLGSAEYTAINYDNLNNDIDPNDPAEDGWVTVTNALDKKTTYFFKTILGVRKIVRVEGENNTSCATAGKAYTYNSAGFLTSKIDWNDNKTTYTPDTKGRETVRVEASLDTAFARTTNTYWDSAINYGFNLPTKIENTLRKTEFTYWPTGQAWPAGLPHTKTVTNKVNANTTNYPVQVWTYATYNEDGQVLTGTDPRGNGFEFTYYSNGDLHEVINGKEQTIATYSDYNARGQPAKKVDANNVETDYEWYPRGWLKKVTVKKPGGGTNAVTEFIRDNVGQLTQLIRPDGSVMGYIYDNAHRLHAIADTHGGLIVYIRDAAGNVVSETVRKDAYSGDNSGTKVQSLTRGFDELSRLIWVKNDAGRKVVSYTYDANGNVETVKRWGCCFAPKIDPLFSPKIDPPFSLAV